MVTYPLDEIRPVFGGGRGVWGMIDEAGYGQRGPYYKLSLQLKRPGLIGGSVLEGRGKGVGWWRSGVGHKTDICHRYLDRDLIFVETVLNGCIRVGEKDTEDSKPFSYIFSGNST